MDEPRVLLAETMMRRNRPVLSRWEKGSQRIPAAPRKLSLNSIHPTCIGCAVVHELASRGASVDAPHGATQASAGVLAPYIEAREGSPLAIVRGAFLFDDFMERVTADSGIAVSYRRSGTLDVAVNDTELDSLRRPRPCSRVAMYRR